MRLSFKITSPLKWLAIAGIWFCCVVPYPARADTRVEVQMGGLIGSSCKGALPNVLVTGSVGGISVIIWSVGTPHEFDGFPEQQPDWLSLEFGYATDGDSFVASPELFHLVNPCYYVDLHQAEANDLLAQGEDIPHGTTMPIHYFLFDVPTELAGRRICVRAVVSPPPFGPIQVRNDLYHRNEACIQIVSPCSDDDRNRALASHIVYERRMGNKERTIALADSLIATGWRNRLGLDAAITSADHLHLYNESLRFLDVMYETYHVVRAYASYPETAESEYQATREILLQKIAEQEQQKR